MILSRNLQESIFYLLSVVTIGAAEALIVKEII